MMERPDAIVVSRSADGSGDMRRFEDAVIRWLGDRTRCPVLVAPHLYYLTPDHPVARRMASLGGRVAVAAWMHARPARWTLAALGCDVECVGRVVRVDERLSPEAFAESLAEGAIVEPGTGSNAVEYMDGLVPSRWYPVVDYSRCVGCRQCLDFCLFGVYELGPGDRVVAANPDQCKPGCPACSRICPAQAIMFPHYEADPVIAGSDASPETPEQKTQGDHGEAVGGLAAAEVERAVCSRQDGGGDESEAPDPELRNSAPHPGEPRDELDRLIDRLDRLDSV